MKYSEKLYNRYKAEIRSWDWITLKVDALTNCYFDQDNQEVMASTFIGSVMALYPSGKYYMPWCTNQTRKDEIRDAAFQEALNDVAEEYDCFITASEGDPCDLLVQFSVDTERFHKHVQFITADEQRSYENRVSCQDIDSLC